MTIECVLKRYAPPAAPLASARIRLAQSAWLAQSLRASSYGATLPITARGYRNDLAMIGRDVDESPNDRTTRRAADRLAPSTSAAPLPTWAEGTTLAPAHRVATDWAWSVWSAGLVDYAATDTRGVVLQSPRDPAPTHEYMLNESPADTPDPAPWPRRMDVATAPLTMGQRVARVVDGTTGPVEDRTRWATVLNEAGRPVRVRVKYRGYPRHPIAGGIMIPAGAMLARAADPAAYVKVLADIEHAADDFLHEYGERWPRGDVRDRRNGRYHAAPDRLAHRGTARYTLPAPIRYERTVTDRTARGVDGQIELATTWTWREWCECLAATRDACVCDRRGWVGHRFVILPATVRKARAQVKVKRAANGATGARGPARGPWTLSDRSLPATVKGRGVDDIARMIETMLRSAADGQTIRYGAVTVTVNGAATVMDDERGRAYPMREWSRRAALAGIDPAAIS